MTIAFYEGILDKLRDMPLPKQLSDIWQIQIEHKGQAVSFRVSEEEAANRAGTIMRMARRAFERAERKRQKTAW